jgi:hypothetical protein
MYFSLQKSKQLFGSHPKRCARHLRPFRFLKLQAGLGFANEAARAEKPFTAALDRAIMPTLSTPSGPPLANQFWAPGGPRVTREEIGAK